MARLTRIILQPGDPIYSEVYSEGTRIISGKFLPGTKLRAKLTQAKTSPTTEQNNTPQELPEDTEKTGQP